MATRSIYAKDFPTRIFQFVPNHATRPKVVLTAPSTGPIRVHFISGAHNNGGTIMATLYYAKPITLASNMGSPDITGQNTINRTSGSFVTDGWLVGERLLLSGATSENNNVLAYITSVGASALGFAAATFGTNETIPSGAKLFKIGALATKNFAANSGTGTTNAALSMIDSTSNTMVPAMPNAYLTLGANDALAVGINTTLSASQTFDVVIGYSDYSP